MFTCPVPPPYPPLLLHYPVWGPQLALLGSKVPAPSGVPDREHVMNKFPFSFLKLWFNIYSGLGTLLGQNLGPEGVEGSTPFLPIEHHRYTQTPHGLITTKACFVPSASGNDTHVGSFHAGGIRHSVHAMPPHVVNCLHNDFVIYNLH